MVAPNDIAQRCQEIHLLIMADDVDRATRRAMDFVRDFSEDRGQLNEVIVISGSYTRLEKRERQGLLDYEEAERQRRKLIYQMLELVDLIQRELATRLVAA